MAESNNWSELPAELLCMVEKRLSKLKDVHRFRATCKPWRRSLVLDQPPSRRRFRQSLPWLMLPYCSEDVDSSCPAMTAGCKGSDSCRRFFDVAEQRFHHIEMPEGLDKRTCRGSAFGWVFTLQRSPLMFLLNPLTKEQIALPPITSFPDILKYRPEKIGHEYLLLYASCRKAAQGKKYFESTLINKMALSGDPAVQRDFVVMVIRCLDNLRLAFCRPREDQAWTLVSVPGPGAGEFGFRDVVFWRGQFYGLDSCFRVAICDISVPGHPRLRWFVERRDKDAGEFDENEFAENFYLSVSPTGDELMVVARYVSYPDDDEDEDGGAGGADIHPVGDDVEDDEADLVLLDKDSDDEHRMDPGESLDSRVHCTIRFKVYKLKEDTKEWVEVESIGEYALFLGFNTSTWVSARDHPEIASNSIYFTDDMRDFHYKKVLGGSDMGMFSLSTGTVHPLYDTRSLHNNPAFIFPYPVWFLPSST